MNTKNKLPEPVSRSDIYLSFLSGNTEIKLPEPMSRKDKYLYYLCTQGLIDDEKIKTVLEDYLKENPISTGATQEQVEQIQKNTEDIYLLMLNENLVDSSEVVGLCVDYENKTFERLGGAVNLNAGEDFDKYKMYGGRKRCTVSDSGAINHYYGDEDYVEDGSDGQVMVYQPKVYYRVTPLKLEKQTDGIGYHLRKANYYISSVPKPGFSLHPAFYNESGQEVEYILFSAYEGSVYDTSASAYLLSDEQVVDFTSGTGDKLCSIAGAKPASGKTQQLTRPNIEQLAKNRGEGWHSDIIKTTSLNQLLMMIELGTLNTQTAGQGAVSVGDTPNTENNSLITGGTSELGNTTGQATGTAGQTSVSYRGIENPWGNIWKFVYGINIHGDGTQKGGVPYICTNFNFAESKNSENHISAGFTLSNVNGYISAMGYSQECDWLFMPSEASGNSVLPVGDYYYCTPNLNGYRIALLGGTWSYGGNAGGFCWYLASGVGNRTRTIGGRLVYIPN